MLLEFSDAGSCSLSNRKSLLVTSFETKTANGQPVDALGKACTLANRLVEVQPDLDAWLMKAEALTRTDPKDSWLLVCFLGGLCWLVGASTK